MQTILEFPEFKGTLDNDVTFCRRKLQGIEFRNSYSHRCSLGE